MAEKSPDVDACVDATLARHGGLSFLEIPATDLARSTCFHSAVLNWNIEDAESDHPKFMDQTRHLLGRWKTDRAVARDAGFVPYFYVNDVPAAVAIALANGGEIVRQVYPEGNLKIAIVLDPAGNRIGLWQEAMT
jgi:uncharacterized protein